MIERRLVAGRVGARRVVRAGADVAGQVRRGRVHAGVEDGNRHALAFSGLPRGRDLDLVERLHLVGPDRGQVGRRGRQAGHRIGAGPFRAAAADGDRLGERRGDGGDQLGRRVEDHVPALAVGAGGPAVRVPGDGEHDVRSCQLRDRQLPRGITEQRGGRARHRQRPQPGGRVLRGRQAVVEAGRPRGAAERQHAERVDRAAQLVGVVGAQGGDAAVGFRPARQRDVDRGGARVAGRYADPAGRLRGIQAGGVGDAGGEELAGLLSLPALRDPGGGGRGKLSGGGLADQLRVRPAAGDDGHGQAEEGGDRARNDPYRAPWGHAKRLAGHD